MDEVTEIFKGQYSPEYLFEKMVYKDMLDLRNTRVERLNKEREMQEEQRKKDEAEQRRLNARNKIMQ